MYSIIILLGFCGVGSLALSCNPRTAAGQVVGPMPRIVGGEETDISKYPSAAVLLDFDIKSTRFSYRCGGVIVNVRSILSAAACIWEYVPTQTWRVRVGSSFVSRDGVVHHASKLILHPDYNMCTRDNDIALIRSSTAFEYNDNVKKASIAGKNYIVRDGEQLWAIGWGTYNQVDLPWNASERLREMSTLSVNMDTCREIYKSSTELNVSQSMMCTGLLGVSGRRHCIGDNGSPVYHNGVVVSIHVWDNVFPDCSYDVPGVNMKVSSYIDWLEDNI